MNVNIRTAPFNNLNDVNRYYLSKNVGIISNISYKNKTGIYNWYYWIKNKEYIYIYHKLEK